MLEHRHDVGQRERHAGPVERQPRRPVVAEEVEPDGELGPVAQHGDVPHRGDRVDVGPVRGGERVAPGAHGVEAGFLPLRRDEYVTQLVDPVARDLAELDFEGALGDDGRCAGRRLHDNVQAGENRVAHEDGEVDLGAADAASHRFDDSHADRGRVAVARQVHQARDKPSERVPVGEEAYPPPFAKAHDADRQREQLAFGQAEQLVTGDRLEHVPQGAPVMTGGYEARGLHHVRDLAPHHRQVVGGLAVRVGGVEAEQQLAVHGHDVQRHRAVDRGPFGGLGQRENWGAGARGDGREPDGVASTGDAERVPVGAVAHGHEREVVVDEPVEEHRSLRRFVVRIVADAQLGREVERALAHRLPVVDRGPHVGEGRLDLRGEGVERGAIALAVDLGMHEGLALEHGVEQEMYVIATSREQRAHAVDDERHVVGDDLDDSVRRRETVARARRVVDAHRGRPGWARRGEGEVRSSGSREVGSLENRQIAGVGARDVEPFERAGFGRGRHEPSPY